MKAFLKKVSHFLLPIIILAYQADVFISKKLKESKTHAGGEYPTWNALYEGKINAEVVIHGSSRAQVHISPLILSDSLERTSYNLGLTGHNFWAQYFRHKELLQYNSTPTLIIHSVDMWTLVKREDLFNPDQFLPYMLYDTTIESFSDAYMGYEPVDFWIPMARYYGKKIALLHTLKLLLRSQPETAGRIQGYEGKEIEWNNDLAEAQEEMSSYEIEMDSLTIILFDQYIKESLEHRMDIILVYTPEYMEGQNFVKNREEVMNVYRFLSIKYKIPFLDYSNDPISLDKANFFNASHLNKRGAELFTKRLGHDIKLLEHNRMPAKD